MRNGKRGYRERKWKYQLLWHKLWVVKQDSRSVHMFCKAARGGRLIVLFPNREVGRIHRSALAVAWIKELEWMHRAAERVFFGGPGQIYKKWGPTNWIVWGGPRAHPQEILWFHMLWSVLWGLLRLFFVHAHSTYNIYVQVAISSGFRSKSTTYRASGLRSSHVR